MAWSGATGTTTAAGTLSLALGSERHLDQLRAEPVRAHPLRRERRPGTADASNNTTTLTVAAFPSATRPASPTTTATEPHQQPGARRRRGSYTSGNVVCMSCPGPLRRLQLRHLRRPSQSGDGILPPPTGTRPPRVAPQPAAPPRSPTEPRPDRGRSSARPCSSPAALARGSAGRSAPTPAPRSRSILGSAIVAGVSYQISADNDEVCNGCHNLKIHNSASTSTGYGTWGTTHLPPATAARDGNIYLVRSASRPRAAQRSVDFRAYTTGQENYGLVNALSLGSGPRSVPHDDPQRQGSPRRHRQLHRRQRRHRRRHDLVQPARGGLESARDRPRVGLDAHRRRERHRADAGGRRLPGAPPAPARPGGGQPRSATPAPAARRRRRHFTGNCITCHWHEDGFKPAKRSGPRLLDLPQLRCWSATPADHDLPPRAGGGRPAHAGLTYPTAVAFDGRHRRPGQSCVQCHADHNVFSPPRTRRTRSAAPPTSVADHRRPARRPRLPPAPATRRPATTRTRTRC